MRGGRLREAIQLSAKQVWIASSLSLLAMTNSTSKTARPGTSAKTCLVAGEDDEKASRLISEIPKFRLPTNPNHFYIDRCPVPQRGVAHVTNAGRDAVDAAARETNAAFWRTAKSCRSDAPMPASSLR